MILATLLLALVQFQGQDQDPISTQCMVKQGSYQSPLLPCTVGVRTLEDGDVVVMYTIGEGGPSYGYVGSGFVNSRMLVNSLYLRSGGSAAPSLHNVERASVCTRDDGFFACGVTTSLTGTDVIVVAGVR